MLLSVETWYEAIQQRHSVRSYTGAPVDSEIMGRLVRTGQDFSGPAGRVFISQEPVELIFEEAEGIYGKALDSTAFAAIISNSSEANFQEKCGYMGEAVVLEAVANGLGTLWTAGRFSAESAAQVVSLGPDEDVLAVITLGYEALDHEFQEKIPKKVSRVHSRRELDELTSGLAPGEWPGWVPVALEAARLAPSAMNRQPWRFEVTQDSVTISVSAGNDNHRIPKRLDCGIAMLHLEVGARHEGVEGRWEYLDAPQVARFIKS